MLNVKHLFWLSFLAPRDNEPEEIKTADVDPVGAFCNMKVKKKLFAAGTINI